MDDFVVYTDVKFTKDEEQIKPRKMVFNTLKSHSLSKVTWILVFAVLILFIVVVGMTIEVVRLRKGSRCSGLSPQPDRNGCDLPSNGQPGMTALGEILCSCGPPCPFGWLLHKGQCYQFSREEQDRQSALRSCSSNYFQLADTEDPGTLNFLRQHMGNTFYWIGLNKTDHDSRWLWTGGRPLNRTYYFNNTDHHNKNCAEVSIDKIYAESCTLKKRYICEKKAHC
ncbi:C-type lectin domain family 2 member B-like isoform X2 [Brienomyrus brachyistius]|uniref:C-type lectin domain family 2 member B-like isoform X2 n=1 Tax=Brienomyrus brachyistius TaxID=42636 RepID=UPI0020B2663B|nr:C-type lectin domain family 2 member B-like isoform X2 [Brienomyrus brachyistius]